MTRDEMHKLAAECWVDVILSGKFPDGAVAIRTIEMALDCARTDALEEAAKACINVMRYVDSDVTEHPGYEAAGANRCLDAIRALKGK